MTMGYIYLPWVSLYTQFLDCLVTYWVYIVHRMMKLSIAILPFFGALINAADKTAWKSRSIYFALTDRIARNSNDNGGSSCGNLGDYCGGTFQGLQGKLDYIKGMGFDAIWITPVVASTFYALSLILEFYRLYCWIR